MGFNTCVKIENNSLVFINRSNYPLPKLRLDRTSCEGEIASSNYL